MFDLLSKQSDLFPFRESQTKYSVTILFGSRIKVENKSFQEGYEIKNRTQTISFDFAVVK